MKHPEEKAIDPFWRQDMPLPDAIWKPGNPTRKPGLAHHGLGPD